MKYKRILLKLSGESLMGSSQFGYEETAIIKILQEVKKAHEAGCEIAVVVGGGNICRGKMLASRGLDHTTGDYMGMLATVMNGLFLQDVFRSLNVDTRVMTALAVNQVAEPFIRLKAIKHLQKNRVVILAGGTGNPFCTTDTAAALRARELECSLILKITKVDGIYDKDPNKFPDAIKLEELTFSEVLERDIEVMDKTAFTMCLQSNIPIIVSDVFTADNIINIAQGQKIGTLVK